MDVAWHAHDWQADDWRERDWQVQDRRSHDRRNHDWRDHDWRDQDWRDHDGPDDDWRGQERQARGWQDRDWQDQGRTFGRSAASMPHDPSRSGRRWRASLAIAGLALCSAVMIGVPTWATFMSGAAPIPPADEVVASITQPAVPDEPAPPSPGLALLADAMRKAARALSPAADPGGNTWRYLLNAAIVSHIAEFPALTSTSRFVAIARDAEPPAFIRPRVASLEPNPFLDLAGVSAGKTDLVGFNSSAFPYRGVNPRTRGGSFGGQRYSDNSVLMHVPTGFNPRKPGVIVVFFHGHGATLARDVRDRQLLPRQISESGVNAVLVAPQLAYDAADSSAGKFWQRDGLKHFLDEAAVKLAKLTGDPSSKAAFARMPVVVVAYSGGFVAAAWSLHVGGVGNRVRGVVLMDALYGELDKFNSWITNHRSAFFVSAYTRYTKRRDDDFARRLDKEGIDVVTELDGPLKPGTVAFLETSGLTHRDFVTRAWTSYPIADVLERMAQR